MKSYNIRKIIIALTLLFAFVLPVGLSLPGCDKRSGDERATADAYKGVDAAMVQKSIEVKENDGFYLLMNSGC